MGISIHVDLDEVYDQMDSWGKKEMVSFLRDDGYLTEEKTPINEGVSLQIPLDATFEQEQHLRMISKLGGLFYRMSDEDMEIIRNIVNKY